MRCARAIAWIGLLLVGFCASAERETVTPLLEPSLEPLLLWYRAPAAKWTDALAIGNGRLGAMVYGRPRQETLQLNDITVWSGGPQPDANRSKAYLALPAIRAALAQGDYDHYRRWSECL
jgi:alpha-L-fucosidase 2